MESKDSDIVTAIDGQLTRLEAKVKLLDKFKHPKTHHFKFHLSAENDKPEPDWSRFEFELKPFGQFVYVIRTEELSDSKMYGMYNDFKERIKNDEFRLSSNNEDFRTKDFNQVLYVGTSSRGMSSFKRRLREHLGIVGPKIYSLQLGRWFQPRTATIHVEVFPISDDEKGILYDFENALWDFYEPLFGKKGVNVSSSVRI